MLNSELKTKSYLTVEEIENFFETPRQTKKKFKKIKQTSQPVINVPTLKEINPLTKTQKDIFESFFNSNQQIFLHGYAGTGKSFISIYLLMKELLTNTIYKKLVIIRSTVPSRDQGFLPGNAAEKAKIYEMPYYSIYNDLFGRSDAYEYHKKKKLVEFESTSYLRGTTFNDCLIFLDEAQNLTKQEMMTVLTRVGENCRFIVSGDFKQTDLFRDAEKKDILDMFKILKTIKSVDFFEFKKEDIVRSKFVKELIIAESKYRESKY